MPIIGFFFNYLLGVEMQAHASERKFKDVEHKDAEKQ